MIQQVTVTSCSSQTFEPFIRPLDPMTRANMLSAGYTDEADLACLQGALNDYALWTHVALDFPFNPFPHINPDSDAGAVRIETDTPIQIMKARAPRSVIAWSSRMKG